MKFKSKYTGTQIENKLDNVEAKFTATEKTKLANLENYDDSEIKADIEAVQTGLDTVNQNISELQKTTEQNQSDISDLQSDTANNKTNISALQSEVTERNLYVKSTLGAQHKNLFNFKDWLNSITNLNRGTIVKKADSMFITATSDDAFTSPFTVEADAYKISVEPSTKYTLSWASSNSLDGAVYVFFNGSNVTGSYVWANNSVTKSLTFTTPTDTTFITVRFGVMHSGTSINYLNIMLRYADITNATYESYVGTIDSRVTQNISDTVINKNTLGTQCKNLLQYKAKKVEQSEFTYVISEDGTIILNGTPTETINIDVTLTNLPVGNYILSGCPEGGGATTYYIRAYYTLPSSGSYNTIGDDTGNTLVVPVTNDVDKLIIRLSIRSGQTVDNLIFKPMLRDARIADSSFASYRPNLQEQLNSALARIEALETTLASLQEA